MLSRVPWAHGMHGDMGCGGMVWYVMVWHVGHMGLPWDGHAVGRRGVMWCGGGMVWHGGLLHTSQE